MVKRPNARWRLPRRFVDTLLLSTLMLPFAVGNVWGTGEGVDCDAHAAAVTRATPGTANVSETLYLEVILNQTRQPQLLRFERCGTRFIAEVAELRRLGFALAGRTPDEFYDLDLLPGTRMRYESRTQQLLINAPLSELTLPTTQLKTADFPMPSATASPGALLNYDIYASHDGDSDGITTATELRVFGFGRGLFSNTAIARALRREGEEWQSESVRLDTHGQWSFPESAVTLTVGDTFSGFLNWTRPVRLGGVQIGRNYALQPYRVTTPLPAFLGEAALPSEVELYIEGVRRYRAEVPMGPFELTSIPGVSGAGQAQVVVTDAFGRSRTLTFPFYMTQRLLARGLSDWSLSLGVVRQEYGLSSYAYGDDTIASGNLRYGLNDYFTLETHAEGGAELVNAGLGGVWLAGRAGVISASWAQSTLAGLDGSQTSLGYAWNSRRFNLSLESQRTHGDYRDIAALYGRLPPSISERAQAGVRTAALGNLGVSYVRFAPAEADAETSRFGSLFWSRSFSGRWSANLSYNQNLAEAADRSLHLGIMVPLDRRHQFSSSWQRNNGRDNGVVDLARPLPGDGGYGWRVQGRGGDGSGGGLAEASWLGNHGRIGAGVARVAERDYGYAQASGGLVWMGGGVFASRTVNDAFAVVSTEGVGGVPVRLENREIGHTDDHGLLLVTRLNAWQRNKLSIDPMDLPADVRLGAVEQNATPSDRAGIRVAFPIRRVRAALLILHDGAGRPLPLGSRVWLEGAAEGAAVVGYDGETYLDTLEAHNRLRVRTPQGLCHVGFDYPHHAGPIPRVGPLLCREEGAR